MGKQKDIWPGIGLTASRFDWGAFAASSSASQRSTAVVERKRREGSDNSTIHGISRKHRVSRIPETMGTRGPPVGYGMQPDSKAGRIRALLVTGPKTRAEIAEATGASYSNLHGILVNDIRQGRVVVLRDSYPMRFALGEQHA